MDDINKRAKIRKKKEKKRAVEKKVELNDQIQHELFVEDMKERYRIKAEREQATINELLTGPRPGEAVDDQIGIGREASVASVGSGSSSDVGLSGTPPNQWSFAKITQMGYFPDLSSSLSTSPDMSSSPPFTVLSAGAWGNKLGVSPPQTSNVNSSGFISLQNSSGKIISSKIYAKSRIILF